MKTRVGGLSRSGFRTFTRLVPIFSFLLWCTVGPLLGQTTEEQAKEYYGKYCGACHTIGGGPLLGPDLKDLSQRQSREWLLEWLLDPEGVLASGDPYALKLQQESMGAIMPRTPGMNRPLAGALLHYIDEVSGMEAVSAAPEEVAEEPLGPEQVEAGRELFTGQRLLKNGGPACIACHTVAELGGLGGGRLGPDLTRTYARLGGRRGLTAWLSLPPSPTMSPVFADHPLEEEEILSITAYLQDQTGKDVPPHEGALINFVILGVAGAAVMLAIFDRLWNKRFRSVRKAMVKESYQ